MSAVTISLIAFALIMAGALLGALLRQALPDHHLADNSKDVVRLGTGLVATIAALVLGLLIASAKSSYDTQASQVRQLTAHVVLLDRLLAQYGTEAHAARNLLRDAIGPLVERIWRENRSQAVKARPFEEGAASELAYAKLQELSPQTEAQRSLKARAVQVSTDLAQTRLLLFEQSDSAIPTPFLAVLIFWLLIIFASFSLFSPLNATVIAALLLFGACATTAIYLILELGQPFSGLMQISSQPLRHALLPL